MNKEPQTLTARISAKSALITEIKRVASGDSYEERNARHAVQAAREHLQRAEERLAAIERTKDRAPELLRNLEADITELLRKQEMYSKLPAAVLERKLKKRARLIRELAEVEATLSETGHSD